MIPIGSFTDLLSLKELVKIDFDLSLLWKVGIMIAAVLAVQSLIVLILSLPKFKNHRAGSILSIVSSLVRYISVIIILCWGLSIFGVNISTIIASLGIIALIVGFSAESLIADIVTGAFMIIENQYNVGDIIEVDGFRGTVTSIGIRTTCITDNGGNVKILNNSTLKNIINRSDRFSRSICDIGIPYETDLEALEEKLPELLLKIYEAHTDIMKSTPRYLGVQELADSAVVLRFVADVEDKDIFSGNRVLNRDLLLGFRKLGVEVPFMQVDIHPDKA
ncbi:MAG: mechanosensitive ion channel [Lachnospiraceae bacterium]|nr:mechanosensitive ion channel [Lachnospiraceae bacterium]